EDAPRIYKRAQQLANLEITGVDCHIGSQITQVAPYLDALDKLLDLIETLQTMGISIQHLDLGGGIGIRYKDEQPLTPKTLLDNVFAKLKARNLDHLQIILEPGRSLVGNAGVLLTTVEYLKHSEHKNFAVVDAAMNDLLRPTLYDAWHDVLAVTPRKGTAMAYDVVGPVCESGDWLAKNRELVLKQDDLLAVMSAGAYAFTMASQYNSRPRPAEIMVDGNQAHVVRQRETIGSLFELEAVLP
ncbi:MAG TPA: diaminopimelate decarboxylase, partial [Burkholderiaceae bacterium]|nr:diaminopimelate decarboxylase [Burkholderiaceae bacterium]